MMSKIIAEDVVEEILLKLPVKSLLRFRCVCKEWRFLVDSNYFIIKHLEFSRKKKTHCILVSQENSTFSLVSEETLDIVSRDIKIPSTQGVTIYGPINGIVSLCDYSKILFCNPSTREVKALPPPIYTNPFSQELSALEVALGFGFDEKSNDYKFVRIVDDWELTDNENRLEYHFDMKFEIYSLRSDCWRKLDYLQFRNAYFHKATQSYLNGACHWFVSYCFDERFDDEECEQANTIMSFRMDTEVLEEYRYHNKFAWQATRQIG